MILTVLKTYIKKREPEVINYTNYKNLNERLFKNDLIKKRQHMNNAVINYDTFRDIL